MEINLPMRTKPSRLILGAFNDHECIRRYKLLAFSFEEYTGTVVSNVLVCWTWESSDIEGSAVRLACVVIG
ncbi:hypothetical protein Plhal304r1_c020g0070541 [Plasmopara halstedii]